MTKVPEIFGSLVFNETVMKEKDCLKMSIKHYKTHYKDGKPLDLAVANVVANAMKDWAIEKV